MCGAALQPGDAREERKVVTVLFTDLVGFTSRAERLDPEDVRATLSPYYARLREQIEQRGGTVEKFIGDAVMAVFGAPVAHEDDPERAVRTALAIRDAIQEDAPELQIRTAVNTGEALVSLGARPSEGEGFVSGDVVNTAARLQSAAPIDGILVGEATYRATRHVIDYRDAEPVQAKGKSEPVPVWEAVAARSRLGVDVEQRSRTRLVGRDREIALLTDAVTRCRSEATAQLVTLVGVPGIGKSRLVGELMRRLDEDPELYVWRQGRSLPYGETQSFWALGEIVKAQAGILETDDVDAADGKLVAMLEPLLPEVHERRWVESHIRRLLGVAGDADEGSDRRAEAFAAWLRLLEALAEQHPLVLIFEDLHWADDGLLDFVDHLAGWVAGVPMLVVATARPELLDRRPGWGGGKRNAATVSIGALSPEETSRLLSSLLEQTLLPAEVQAQVLRSAGGNPLYAEEYVRMLQDRGLLVRGPSGWRLEQGADLPVPETVQGMIAARLDALTPEEKELVQDASVLGKVFWPGALGGRVSADALHALELKEFIRRDRRSAVAGETQYAFLHLLVRDVAYGQIPRARRADKHRAAAEWIASLARDRSEDRSEMLAHHYGEALALADAAGIDTAPLRTPARAAIVEASERAAMLNAWTAAEELSESALALVDADDPLRPALQLRICRSQASRGAPDLALLETACAGFLANGDEERAGEAEALLSWSYWWLGDGDSARLHAERALELVRDQPVSIPKVRAYAQVARRTTIGGDIRDGAALARETLAMAEELEHDELTSHALNTLGLACMRAGDLDGLKHLERSVELADRSNAPDEMIRSRNNLANQLFMLGRLDEATAQWVASREAAQRTGLDVGLVWADAELMIDSEVRGDLAGALARAEGVLAVADERDQVYNVARVVRAKIFARIERIDEALRDIEVGLLRAREVADPQHLGGCLVDIASVLFAAGHDVEANLLMDELLADPDMMRFTDYGPDVPLLLTEQRRGPDYIAAVSGLTRNGLWADASAAALRGDLTLAADIYGAMGARFGEAWARLLAAERGHGGQLERAHAYFNGEGAVPYIRRCEALLSASA
jgi:class 3 adenylate cyclase/tetratricopeptide (TPR) repeat protein